MLKSQGPENRPRGRPGLLWAPRTNRALSGAHRSGKPGRDKKPLVGWRHVTPQVRSTCGILFSFVNGGEGAVTVQKGSVSFGQKRPRSRGEPNSPAGLCLPSAPGADQQSGGSAGSCSVCSAAARGGAAGPGPRIENHRRRLGWEGAARPAGGSGVGFLFRRFAEAVSADAGSSGGVGGRLEQSVRAVSGTAVAVAGRAGI